MTKVSNELSQETLDAFVFFTKTNLLKDCEVLKRSSAIAQLDAYWASRAADGTTSIPMHRLVLMLACIKRGDGMGVPFNENPEFEPYFEALARVRELCKLHEAIGLGIEHLRISPPTPKEGALLIIGARYIDGVIDFVDLETDEQYSLRKSLLESAFIGSCLEKEYGYVNKRGPKSADTYAIRKLWDGIELSEAELLDRNIFNSPYAMLAELLHAVGYDMELKIVEQTIKQACRSA